MRLPKPRPIGGTKTKLKEGKKMNHKQLDTAIKLVEKLHEEKWISKFTYWEIEGAFMDLYYDDHRFLNSLTDYVKEKAINILRTSGYPI